MAVSGKKLFHMLIDRDLPPAPIGKNIWGAATINDRGQIVIPKGARDRFDLSGGQRLIVGSDERGIALIPAQIFEELIKKGMAFMAAKNDDTDQY